MHAEGALWWSILPGMRRHRLVFTGLLKKIRAHDTAHGYIVPVPRPLHQIMRQNGMCDQDTSRR